MRNKNNQVEELLKEINSIRKDLHSAVHKADLLAFRLHDQLYVAEERLEKLTKHTEI